MPAITDKISGRDAFTRHFETKPATRFATEPDERLCHAEETMVIDRRAGMRPAEVVEQKLIVLLKNETFPLRYLAATASPVRRRHC